MNNLGDILKHRRLELHMSQSAASDNICSQPMLSSIEKGKYIPNSEILILLCKRLKIDMNQLSLNNNYQISSVEIFNNTVTHLCNNHEYFELKEFLLKKSTVESIASDNQLQAYYYYLGIAFLQSDNDLDQAEVNLKLAMTNPTEHSNLTTLDRLVLISSAVVYATKQQPNLSDMYIQKAFKQFNSATFETNQVALFYLAGYANLLINNKLKAIKWLNQGIDFASNHDSHYMLANMYYLLAKILMDTDKSELALDYQNRSQIFTDLFHEKVFK